MAGVEALPVVLYLDTEVIVPLMNRNIYTGGLRILQDIVQLLLYDPVDGYLQFMMDHLLVKSIDIQADILPCNLYGMDEVRQ
jgi:hypothetical protein